MEQTIQLLNAAIAEWQNKPLTGNAPENVQPATQGTAITGAGQGNAATNTQAQSSAANKGNPSNIMTKAILLTSSTADGTATLTGAFNAAQNASAAAHRVVPTGVMAQDPDWLKPQRPAPSPPHRISGTARAALFGPNASNLPGRDGAHAAAAGPYGGTNASNTTNGYGAQAAAPNSYPSTNALHAAHGQGTYTAPPPVHPPPNIHTATHYCAVPPNETVCASNLKMQAFKEDIGTLGKKIVATEPGYGPDLMTEAEHTLEFEKAQEVYPAICGVLVGE